MPYPASSSSTALGNVFQASDGNFTETFVIPASAPYTHQIGAAAPYNMPAGWQIIPPNSVSNAVTVTGAAHASWTSVPSSPTAGQFVYDATISPTGGTLTFAASDAGQTVIATWIGSTDINKALMQALVTALHDIGAAAGAPSGLATLTAAGAVGQDPASKGLANGVPILDGYQRVVAPQGIIIPGQTGSGAATNVAGQAAGWFRIPLGTTHGTSITLISSLCVPTSLMVFGYEGGSHNVLPPTVVGKRPGSFDVMVSVVGAGTTVTNAAIDVSYLIVNAG